MGLLRQASRTLLGVNILFLLLLGFSLRYLEPGTGSYVVAQLTLIPTVLTLAGSVFVIYTDWTPFE